MVRPPLEELLEIAQPVIDHTLLRRCAGWLRDDEIADIRSTVLLRLLLRLRRADAPAIENFDSFVATLASNAVNDHLRRRYPERTRLKHRLRYLCTVHHDLALGTIAGTPVCALRAWPRAESVPPPLGMERPDFPDAAFDERNAAAAVTAVLESIGRPLTLDDLVSVLHGLWQGEGTAAVGADHLVDPRPSAASALEQRNALERLWSEIQRLPPSQRAALLLNLRDADGGNALALLVLLGVATFDAVASAIGVEADVLAALWSRMPIDDLEIAERLRLSRQQVINLRKAARRRLERFLKRGS